MHIDLLCLLLTHSKTSIHVLTGREVLGAGPPDEGGASLEALDGPQVVIAVGPRRVDRHQRRVAGFQPG